MANLEAFEVSQSGPTEAAAVEAQTDGGELTERTKLIDPMTMEESSVPFLSSAEAAVESAARKTKIKPLSLLPLIALIFYDVSGGPFGTEVSSLCSLCTSVQFLQLPNVGCSIQSFRGHFVLQDAVSAGGPLLAILGFLLLPLIWSVPEALITAELATTFPENSGYVAWVTAAFGPFWGFQVRQSKVLCRYETPRSARLLMLMPHILVCIVWHKSHNSVKTLYS